MGDLVLLYSVASDTRTRKPSHTSPESERKDGASCVAGRPFSLSGFAELQAQPCSRDGRPQETQGPLPRGAGRNSSVNSSPKGIPCSTLHNRLPVREIKEFLEAGGGGKQTGLGRTPCSLLPAAAPRTKART